MRHIFTDADAKFIFTATILAALVVFVLLLPLGLLKIVVDHSRTGLHEGWRGAFRFDFWKASAAD
jgi:hypothetical protein